MSLFGERDKEQQGQAEPSERSELSENLEVLRQLPIFKNIPFEIIKLYAYTAQRRRYREGDYIFRQGEPASRAHVILSGEIRLSGGRDGQQFEMQVLKQMGFFGYMSLLADFEWPLSSQALTDAELLILNRESFRKIMTRYPEQCILIVEKLVQMRIQRMHEHMGMLMDRIAAIGS